MRDFEPESLGALRRGDCLDLFRSVPEGSVDLAFADPPFNIGYRYDVYEDRLAESDYLDWSRAWGAEVVRVLKPDGTFWLAIGDEYAAELKVMFHRELGLSFRSWVIWYYTFGVNCTRKFSRSHAHLLYFTKDEAQFTFRDEAIRVPSGPADDLRRQAVEPKRPPARRHLDLAAAGRARRLRGGRGHLERLAGLRHVQGKEGLARLPDARAHPGSDHRGMLARGGDGPWTRSAAAAQRWRWRRSWVESTSGSSCPRSTPTAPSKRLTEVEVGQPLDGVDEPFVTPKRVRTVAT